MKKRPSRGSVLFLFFCAGIAAGFCLCYVWLRGIPFVKKTQADVWSIGMLGGASPFALAPLPQAPNPVLTAADVTDREAVYVADPFIAAAGTGYCMFFEALMKKPRQGDIALATSRDGIRWRYERIVIDEPFHLSYPYVFEWEGDHYMIPETYQDSSIRLYKATLFPARWEFAGRLMSGYDFIDPSIVRHGGRWWLFAGSTANDVLHLFYADSLSGPWMVHPASPVVTDDPNTARPAGRFGEIDGRLYRFAQDDEPQYGLAVNAFEITALTPASFQERPRPDNPVITAGPRGWNSAGMHHIDLHRIDGRWIACVDGKETKRSIRLAF